PLRRVVSATLRNQTHGAFADFGGKLDGFLHGSILSSNGASTKAGAVHFDAVLWHDAKRSERFSNLSLCAPELPKQSNNFVLTWKSFSISGKTSGQVRTDGPTPPYSKLPSDPAMERWLMNQFGLYYVGSLLTLVGYDSNFTIDDRRFWIRNIKG
ncbi:MAG: hypothetical protein ACU0AU_17865, partial [Cognatishimia activa]